MSADVEGKGEKGLGKVSIDNVRGKREVFQCYYIVEEKDTLIMCADVVFCRHNCVRVSFA